MVAQETSITIPVLTKERMRLRPGKRVYLVPDGSWWDVAVIQADGVILRRFKFEAGERTVKTQHCDWDYVREHVRPSDGNKYSV